MFVENMSGKKLVSSRVKTRMRQKKARTAAAVARITVEAAKEEESQKDEHKKTISFSAKETAPKVHITHEDGPKEGGTGGAQGFQT